jgi:transcriptional regulator with XRE-family HTH domain
MRNIVGENVKRRRYQFKPKMTQAVLAAKLQVDNWDIDRVGIAKIESGLRRVTDIEVLKLAKALSTSACWLLGEQGEG